LSAFHDIVSILAVYWRIPKKSRHQLTFVFGEVEAFTSLAIFKSSVFATHFSLDFWIV
jgi:uncharacterized membrane protein YsdA (DUF1294 family)